MNNKRFKTLFKIMHKKHTHTPEAEAEWKKADNIWQPLYLE